MTITRVGSNQKYASGWESAFGKKGKGAGKKSPKRAAAKKTARGKPTAKKKVAKLPKKKAKTK